MTHRELIYLKIMQSQGWEVRKNFIPSEGAENWTAEWPGTNDTVCALTLTNLFDGWCEHPEVLTKFLNVQIKEKDPHEKEIL